MSRRQKVTLADVALKSGLSIGTVSQALSGNGLVSTEAREKVRTVASQLGYIPKKKSVKRQVKNIGFILVRTGEYSSVQQSPFYGIILQGVEKAANELGFNLVYSVQIAEEGFSPSQKLSADIVDGIVIAGVCDNNTLLRLIPNDIPTVLVDNVSKESGLDSVMANDIDGSFDAVTYLINNGHKRIVLLGSMETHHSVSQRVEGYFMAHRKAGLPIDTSLCMECDLTFAVGYQAMSHIINSDLSYDAIFCVNDELAIGALRACHEHGISVPNDISIVGYDDINLAAHVFPALTTVRVDKEYMGKLAVKCLMDKYKAQQTEIDSPPLTIQVDTRLIIRDSVVARNR